MSVYASALSTRGPTRRSALISALMRASLIRALCTAIFTAWLSLAVGCDALLESAPCTRDLHCTPHQRCDLEEGRCVALELRSDHLSEPPLYPDMSLEDMTRDQELDAELDMTPDAELDIGLDMTPDVFVNPELIPELTPPPRTCRVNLPERVEFRTRARGISPVLKCDGDVLLLFAPADLETRVLTESDECEPASTLDTGESSEDPELGGAESGGAESGGAEGGGVMAGIPAGHEAGHEAGSPEGTPEEPTRLAMFQYTQVGTEAPGWYRVCPEITYPPNTSFTVRHLEDREHRCGVAQVYSRLETGAVSAPYQYTNTKDCELPAERVVPSSSRAHSAAFGDDLGSGLNRFALTLAEGGDPQRASLSFYNNESDRAFECDQHLNSSAHTLRTWGLTLTGYGLAWLQNSPLGARHGELHIMSGFAKRPSGECDAHITDLGDLTGLTARDDWRMPLVYDDAEHLFLCRFSSTSGCELHGYRLNGALRRLRPLELSMSPPASPELLELQTLQLDTLASHLLFVREDKLEEDDIELNVLELWRLQSRDEPSDELSADPISLDYIDRLERGLRFADIKLYWAGDRANERLGVYWLSPSRAGWRLNFKAHDLSR